MAEPITALMAFAALAQAGATGYQTAAGVKSAEEEREYQKGLTAKQMKQSDRQFRTTMRFQRRRQKQSEQTGAINMLAGLEGLRQTAGKPSRYDFLSSLARS